MLILSIESGSMCKHQESSEQSGSYTTLSSILKLNRTHVWNKTWQYTLLGKQEHNSAEKEGFLYASLPPPSCQKQEK